MHKSLDTLATVQMFQNENCCFSPASIQVIEQNLSNPTPLETLLADINQDFAVPLLAQCRQIAEADGIVTEAESKVLDQITQALVKDKAVENTTESAKESVQTVKRGLFQFWKRSAKPS
uniref:TerB family tellurite resistance protein n=1 Tax=Oscillatoriales cyanobacterium SpSt-418 TaxID=2282169 RepID=A0A7C3PGM6_9CYAN